MTMGKSFRKSSARSSIRAPKFLDKSSGFYGRLDEPEMTKEEDVNGKDLTQEVTKAAVDDVEMFIEDDGETLLRRKPSRRSSRWRKSLRRKESKEEKKKEEDDAEVMEVHRVVIEVVEQTGAEERDPALVHFPIREEADDQVLIRDKKRVREEEEEEEERKAKREQEEGMKTLKRNSVKNYRKALDRAFRRGWEAFITNLYSVTITSVSPSSSSPSSPSSPAAKKQHSAVLAEFQ